MRIVYVGVLLTLCISSIIGTVHADDDYGAKEREIIAALKKSMTCKQHPPGKYCFAEYEGTKLEFRAMKDIAVTALGKGAWVETAGRSCLQVCFGDIMCVIAHGDGALVGNFKNNRRYRGCN